MIHSCIIYLRSGATDKVLQILNPNRRKLESHPSLVLKAVTFFLVGVLAYLKGQTNEAKYSLHLFNIVIHAMFFFLLLGLNYESV